MSTISDVAKLAGVSEGTVSRVMNEAPNIRPDTRAKVEQAVAQLGYQPNFQARSLRIKRTSSLALVIPSLANTFWTTIARGVEDTAQKHGYSVLLCNSDGKTSKALQYLNIVVRQRVDGLIMTPVDLGKDNLEYLREHGIPTVILDEPRVKGWNVDAVYGDSLSGSFALTQHLIDLGHRQIAVITGPRGVSTANDRAAGYCMALTKANISIDPQLILWGKYEREVAAELARSLLATRHDVTAILAANNDIAAGVVHAVERQELNIPNDIALVCVDDFHPDSRFASSITVAAQAAYDIGLNAAELLLSRLDKNPDLRPRTVVLPTRLIVRDSSGGERSDDEGGVSFQPGQLITSLTGEEITRLSISLDSAEVREPERPVKLSRSDTSQAANLSSVLRRRRAEFLPHFEYAVTSTALYKDVLEHEPRFETVNGVRSITPEDQVEFAQRVGLAAIPCRYPWQPRTVVASGGLWRDGSQSFSDHPDSYPSFAEQLYYVEQYLRAAQNSGVGIVPDFRSLINDALQIAEVSGSLHEAAERRRHVESVADGLLQYQGKIVQLICDRFADDLAAVMFSDSLADQPEFAADALHELFERRLRQLVAPVKEHGLPVVLHIAGWTESVLPFVLELGFDAVYPDRVNLDEFSRLKQAWADRLTFVGGIPVSLLEHRSQTEIEQQAAHFGSLLAQDGGYVFGVSGEIGDEVSPDHFAAMLHAHRHLQSATQT